MQLDQPNKLNLGLAQLGLNELSEAPIGIDPSTVQDQALGNQQGPGNTTANTVIPQPEQLSTLIKATNENRTQEATDLWGNFFSKGNSGDLIVKVPSNWFFFFTSMLLSPDTFGWATEFLSSSAAAHISENQGNVTFVIPKECPIKMRPCLSNPDLDLSDSGTPGKSDNGKNKGVVIRGKCNSF